MTIQLIVFLMLNFDHLFMAAGSTRRSKIFMEFAEEVVVTSSLSLAGASRRDIPGRLRPMRLEAWIYSRPSSHTEEGDKVESFHSQCRGYHACVATNRSSYVPEKSGLLEIKFFYSVHELRLFCLMLCLPVRTTLTISGRFVFFKYPPTWRRGGFGHLVACFF